MDEDCGDTWTEDMGLGLTGVNISNSNITGSD